MAKGGCKEQVGEKSPWFLRGSERKQYYVWPWLFLFRVKPQDEAEVGKYLEGVSETPEISGCMLLFPSWKGSCGIARKEIGLWGRS